MAPVAVHEVLVLHKLEAEVETNMWLHNELMCGQCEQKDSHPCSANCFSLKHNTITTRKQMH